VRSVSLSTNKDGVGTGSIPIPSSGSFVLTATSAEPGGRRITGEVYLWVSGNSGWNWTEEQQIQMVPDKSKYEIGDTAEVLIVTGAPGVPVLLTTEAGKVYRQEVMTSQDGTVQYRLPITEEYAPNVYVTAAFLKDNKYYSSTKRLNIPAIRQKLQVSIKAPKETFLPGEKATLEVEARDWQGKPAVNAELSLGVVDEAIYAVRPENVGDIHTYFHGNRYNQVYTLNSMDFYFSGEAGKRRMQLASRKQRKTLAELKGERYVDPKVRKYFPDTALWLADVKTDSQGKAKAEITYPDALTTWRTTVRAITPETRTGSGLDRRIVRKNVILRLATPRFFTVGDEVEISAIVMNYLSTAQKIRTTMAVEGLELMGANSQDVEVPSRGEAVVRYRVKASKLGSAKVTGKALGPQESDAIELTIPVRPFGIEMSKSNSGSTNQAAGEKQFEIQFPEGSIANTRNLELKISPSVAGGIFNALEYLTAFPYGCTEQTMSSFLPSVIVSQALDELKIESNVDRAELRKKVGEGIARLMGHQHPDGGWGWWATDESHHFMTAYVLYGLVEAQKAGYDVSDYNLQQARNWLRLRVLDDRNVSPNLRAYMGYALLSAGQPDKAVQDMLHAQLNGLSAHGAALAGLGMQAVKDPRVNEFVDKVERAVINDGVVYWRNDQDDLMGISHNASAETTAYAMRLLIETKPESPLIPKAAEWLVSNRSQGYYWESTKATAMVIFGLTSYLKQSGELKPNLDVEVFVDGKSALKQKFTAADAMKLENPVLRLDAAALGSGKAQVRVVAKGEGRVYWSAVGNYFVSPEGLEREGSVGLNLLREYFSLQPTKRGDRTVYQLGELPSTLKPGDLIAVRLTVTGNDWRYLMIEDPIPAGTEFIDRRESFELENRPPWWSWYAYSKEYRDDRAAIFQYEFDRGQRQFTHILRVVNPGVFHVSPAKVAPMYQPGYQATTGSMRVEVLP